MDDLLPQGLGDALHDAALLLSGDDDRVHDRATVVDGDEPQQPSCPGLRVDLDDRGVAPGRERRPVLGVVVLGHERFGAGDVEPGDGHRGDTHDREPAGLREDDVGRRRFEQAGGRELRLLQEVLGRARDGAAGQHGRAGGPRAFAVRDAGRVAELEHDGLDGQPQPFGEQQPPCRRVPLALVVGAVADDEAQGLPIGREGERGPLGGPVHRGAVEPHRDADTERPHVAPGATDRLLRSHGVVLDPRDRALEARPVVGGVVGDAGGAAMRELVDRGCGASAPPGRPRARSRRGRRAARAAQPLRAGLHLGTRPSVSCWS